MKASISNFRISPRKVRLVANLVKGKKVPDALASLAILPKRSATPIAKLIKSAEANAGKKEGLAVKDIQVNKGVTLKRMMPRAHGRGARINKRTSHIEVTLQ